MKRFNQLASLLSLLIFVTIGCYQKQPVSPESEALALVLMSQEVHYQTVLFSVRIQNTGPDTIDLKFCLFLACGDPATDPVYEIAPIASGATSEPMEIGAFGGYYYFVDGVVMNEHGPQVIFFDGQIYEVVTPIFCEIGAGPNYEITCEKD